MKIHHLLIALLTCTAFFLKQDVAAQSGNYFISDGRQINIDSFDTHIVKMLKDTGLPGISLAIIENDQVVYSHSYGYKNMSGGIPVDQNTLFEACSLSKIFLVYIAYQLVDRGLLDLDKPMYQYLPYKDLEHDSRYKLITPRMILSHTSGLENWRWLNNPDTLEILSDPGKAYTYSGEGFHYLAKVIATILKKPYKDYVREMVLDPLQLKLTTLNYVEADSTGDYARGHTPLNTPYSKKWVTPEPWPASSINTNAAEFSKLMIAIFNGKNLTQKSIREMLDTAKRINKDSIYKNYVTNGFFLITSPWDTIVNFSGNNDGFKADMMYSIVHKRGYVFFVNNDVGILASSAINQLTTRLNADWWYRSGYFRHVSYMDNLCRLYRDKGGASMVEEVNNRGTRYGHMEALEEIAFQLYWIDKPTGEGLAKALLKFYPQSPYSYAILGAASLDLHNDCDLAKSYLLKARELNFRRMDLDGYLKRCNDKLSKR